MGALLLLAGLSLFVQYVRNYEREIAAGHRAAVQSYLHSFAAARTTLGIALDLVANGRRAGAMVAAGNAPELMDAYGAVFERLRHNYGLNSLQFTDLNMRVIFRAQAPEVRGDIAHRPAYADMLRAGIPVSVIDAGRDGRLMLRMARPLYSGRTLTGFVETGMDMDGIIRAAGSSRKTELAFALRSGRLSAGEAERRAGQRPAAFWVEAGEYAIFTTLPGLDADFADRLMDALSGRGGTRPLLGEPFSIVHNSGYYVVNSSPLADSLGQPLGDLFVIENATHLVWEYAMSAAGLFGLGLVVILVSRAVMGRGLDRADKRIKETLRKLSSAEQVFESVFNESETGFVLLRRVDGSVYRANGKALRLFDAAGPEGVRLERLESMPADHPLVRAWEAVGASGALLRIERGQGEAYCVMERVSLGGGHGLDCVALSDVTRIVTLQQERRLYTEYLQRVIDELPTAVCIRDADLKLVMYNAAFDKYFGQGRDLKGLVRHAEWLGRGAMDAILASDRRVLESGRPETAEVELPWHDGTSTNLLVAKRLITGWDGRVYLLVVCSDVTVIKQSELQLALLHDRAEAASVAKSEFLACMSHEMRTPLNVILGLSQLALSAGAPAKLTVQLEKIRDAAGKLLETISHVLDFANLDAGKVSLDEVPFSLEELLQGVADSLIPIAGDKGLDFQYEVRQMPDRFLGDPQRLRQVIFNLLDNAMKFTHEGHIRLIARPEENKNGETVVYFAVEDSGIGIPEERMDRLFMGFNQLESGHDRRYGGAGLGLAVTRRFIHLMGGEIGLRSVEGKGSSFFFRVPLKREARREWEDHRPQAVDALAATARPEFGKAAPAQQPPRAALPPGPDMVQGSGLSADPHENPDMASDSGASPNADPDESPASRVLVAEDNFINQEIIAEILRALSVKADIAADGSQALEMLQQNNYDLVLMDIQMPGMDGLTAARAIRALPDAHLSTIPIVALTANALQKDRDDCREAGMNDFISKPVDMDLLRAKLEFWTSSPERRTLVAI